MVVVQKTVVVNKMEETLEERLKGLKGIKCSSCNDTNFINEWIDGVGWVIKSEPTGELDDHGNPKIRLLKCNHHANLGF